MELVNNDYQRRKRQVIHVHVAELVEVHVESFGIEVTSCHALAADGVHDSPLVGHECDYTGKLDVLSVCCAIVNGNIEGLS